MWIEFLGGVGSGKSSLASSLRERFEMAGVPVNSPQEALDFRLAQSLPKAILDGRTRQGARRVVHAGLQMRFSVKHPKLVWQAWSASQNLRHLPGWHRKIILSLFLEVAGWYEGLSYRVPSKRMIVVDEGLAHRSINLFAWQTGDLDLKMIQKYLKNLPEVPLTILVYAPTQVCLERAYNRGLPARLRGKDPHTIRRFIENSHTVASLAAEILTSQGRSIITADNSSGLELSIATLCDQITETALFQKHAIRPCKTSLMQIAENETL
jgi:thymidylate kinase